MLKKLLMVIGAIVAVIVVLFVVAGIIIYLTVDRDFIASRLASALNRHVTIEKIDVSVFSIVSGIEVNKLAISNFKTPGELAALKGKAVPPGDLFAGMEAFRFKMKFLPLLQRKIELKEIVLQSPVINLAKNKQGALNIDDLIKDKKQPVAAEKNVEKKEATEPAKPISADDIPVAVAVGEIGMKDGTINYYDAQYDQTFQVYKLTTLIYDSKVNPKALETNDELKVKFGMGVKTVGALKTGSVQSFDITLDAAGKVIPFDIKTRLLEPEIILHVGIPDGEISGLQIFNAVASVPLLGDYLGEYISFLKDKQQWKGSKESGLDLRYKAGQADVKNGRLDLAQAKLLFDGGMNLNSKAVDMNMGVVMKKEINDNVQAALGKKIEAAIKSPDVKKYVKGETLAASAMKPLLNKDGLIDLGVAVSGTTQKPVVKLVRPQLGALSVIVKEAAGSAAVEAGKGAVKQLLKEDQQKVLDDVGGLLKRK